MARGWESKSVENQINDKLEQRQDVPNSTLTPAQIAIREKRHGLLLARTHTLNGLGAAVDDRYRALLQKKLAHLDKELATIDAQDPEAAG
jgi:hypothetical protein